MESGSGDTTKRGSIMDAAVRLFSERGYNGVSVREITEAAGITKPTLYYHFGSKQGLCEAILTSLFQEQRAREEQILRNYSSPIEQLRELARDAFRRGREQSHVVKFVTEFLLGPDAANMLAKTDPVDLWKQSGLVRATRAAHAARMIRSDCSHLLIAGVLEGALNRYLLSYVHFGMPELTDDLADSIVSVILEGAAPGQTSGRW